MNNEPVGYFLYNEEYEEWEETFAGTPHSVPLYANPVNPYQSITDTKIEPTVVSYTHPVNTCKHGVDDGACKECYMESTHPVKELTLTEDEIDDVWAACSTGESDTIDMHLFAEAILKKAQEK